MMCLMFAWIVYILKGEFLMKGHKLMEKFEEKINEYLILVFPAMIVTVLHKAVFLIYFSKYYCWDN